MSDNPIRLAAPPDPAVVQGGAEWYTGVAGHGPRTYEQRALS